MKQIHSRDIFYIIRDVLRCLDPRVMNHGGRTAYILYKMLQDTGQYEDFELADLCMIATLHDIGAYKTDYMQDQLRYESRDYMPHSIYGYLFILYLTPFKDKAKIILYHHTDYNKLPKANYPYMDVIECLNVAEKMDIYSNALGSKFDYMMFQKMSGTRLSPKALELLYAAEKKYGVFDKISSGEYKNELSRLFDNLIFTNEEKRDFLLGLMYCVGFRSEYTMSDMVTCVRICEEIGAKMLLSKEESEQLFYAAVLHDAGMAGVPKEIIEAPRKLTVEEIQNLRKHVLTTESILRGRVEQEVIDIISAHHERGDGSGYPRRLKDSQMNRSMKILQVADTITGLTSPRSYREPRNKTEVIAILNEEAQKGRLSSEVVRTFVSHYDAIMEDVRERTKETLSTYERLKENYELTYKQINK